MDKITDGNDYGKSRPNEKMQSLTETLERYCHHNGIQLMAILAHKTSPASTAIV
jgi:hypothetical protein